MKWLKYFFIIFLGFLSSTASAEVSGLQVEKINIKVVQKAELAEIEIQWRVKNTSENSQNFWFFQPILAGGQNFEIFRNLEKVEFEILENIAAREWIFELAKREKKLDFLKSAAPEVEKILSVNQTKIPPQSEIQWKIKLKTRLQKWDDFLGLPLPLPQGNFQNQQVESMIWVENLDANRGRFWSNFELQNWENIESQSAFSLQQKNDETSQTFSFFWSNVPSAKMKYLGVDFEYQAHFFEPQSRFSVDEITFLVDRSGSMSGAKWQKTKDFLRFWLEKLDEKRVRIAFFDTDVSFFQPRFQTNTRDFREKFFRRLESISPLGETDFAAAVDKISGESFAGIDENQSEKFWSSPRERRAVILITDSPEWVDPQRLPARLLAFSFENQNLQKNPLPILASLSGGFWSPIFAADSGMIELESAIRKWDAQPIAVRRNEIFEASEKNEILPEKFVNFWQPNQYFVGRNPKNSAKILQNGADFLPRQWAKLRLAEILEKILENGEFTDSELDAVLSIGRRFGVSTQLFNATTRRSELQKWLHSALQSDLFSVWSAIYDLESDRFLAKNSNTKFWRDIPFYFDPETEKWQSFDFPEKVRAENLVQIAPFSAAQRELFKKFPEFGVPFSMGEKVEFCVYFRCFSVAGGGRENFKISDQKFLRDFDPDHWAAAYFLELDRRGALPLSKNGKIHPSRAIDRGSFVQLLGRVFWPSIESSADFLEGKPIFSDMEKESEFFGWVQFLAKKGAISGYPDGTFRPHQSLTRAEAVKILLAARGIKPKSVLDAELAFSDISGWEKKWVQHAAQMGIVSGFADGTFAPHQSLTRAEAAKLALFENW